MKKFFTFSVVALFASFPFMGYAQDVPEGKWINLFDGESLYGWVSFGDVDCSVVDGVLTATNGSGG